MSFVKPSRESAERTHGPGQHAQGKEGDEFDGPGFNVAVRSIKPFVEARKKSVKKSTRRKNHRPVDTARLRPVTDYFLREFALNLLHQDFAVRTSDHSRRLAMIFVEEAIREIRI